MQLYVACYLGPTNTDDLIPHSLPRKKIIIIILFYICLLILHLNIQLILQDLPLVSIKIEPSEYTTSGSVYPYSAMSTFHLNVSFNCLALRKKY